MSGPKLTGKKVLVTGGAGFIGSNLVDFFLEQENQVVCLDNFSTGRRENLTAAQENKNFTLIEGDIRNQDDCFKAVAGCDFVFHQAALGSVPRSIHDPATSTDVNIGGFVKMLYAAKEEGIKRFIYAASSSTYGDNKMLPKVEHVIGKALSPYAITKYVDELFARNFSEIYGIETIGLRYFNVFGRKQRPDGAYAAAIPKFVNKLIDHESPVIHGDGTYSRDFTYIDNVLQANLLAAVVDRDDFKRELRLYNESVGIKQEEHDLLSEVFNVAYGENVSLNQLTRMLKEILSVYDPEIAKVEIAYGPVRAGDVPHSLAEVRKAREILSYKPEFSMRRGLEEACRWYWTARQS